MNIEEYRHYCIRKKGVTEDFPFDQDTLVFKVMGKMFALASLSSWEKGNCHVNLKCDPDWAEELRASYGSIKPGYHMSKVHWNTVDLGSGELDTSFVRELIDHSYDLVVKGLTKKLKDELNHMP